MDDVELIDLVWDDETKRIWHCADILKSSMLQKALITKANLYETLAPERLMQIIQLVQGQMVKSHRIHVRATNLPTPSMLAYQYLGLLTSPTSNTEVNITCIDVLKLTKCTNRIIWGKFGFSIIFPGEVTDDNFYHPFWKFTNKIVSDMLLREFDEKPSLSAAVPIEAWINDPNESLFFIKFLQQHVRNNFICELPNRVI